MRAETDREVDRIRQQGEAAAGRAARAGGPASCASDIGGLSTELAGADPRHGRWAPTGRSATPSTASSPTSTQRAGRGEDSRRSADGRPHRGARRRSLVIIFVLYRYVLPVVEQMVRGPAGRTSSSRSTRARRPTRRLQDAEKRFERAGAEARQEAATHPRRRPGRRHPHPRGAHGAGRARGRADPPARPGAARRPARPGGPRAARRARRAVDAAGRADRRRVSWPTTEPQRAPWTSSSTTWTTWRDGPGRRPARARARRSRRRPPAGGPRLMAVLLQSASRESLAAAGGRLDAVRRRPVGQPTSTRSASDLFAVLRLLVAETDAAPAPRRSVGRRVARGPGSPTGCSTGKIGRPALDVVVGPRLLALVALGRPGGGAGGAGPPGRARRGGEGRHASTRSRTSCSGSAGSWTGSRELARCSPTRARPPTSGSSCCARCSATGSRRSPRRCWSRPCAPRAGAASTWRPRSSPSWPRPAGTATSRTSAPRCGCPPTRSSGSPSSLTRLYGRPISLQVELDPDLLGGLVVRVGGELIDGSVAGKLAAARRTLPG